MQQNQVKSLVVKEALRQQAEKDVLSMLVPPPSMLVTVTEDETDHLSTAWMTQSYDAKAKPRTGPIMPPRSHSVQSKRSKFYTNTPDDKLPSAEKRSLSTSNAPDLGELYVHLPTENFMG